MQRQRNASDVAIELRKQFGLPKDAPIAASITLLFALTPIFLLRHSIGVRLVGLPRLATLTVAMAVFGLVPSLLLAENTDMIGVIWQPLLLLTLATKIAGLLHRARRWAMRLRGEKLHSLSLGTSWLSSVLPKGNAERYADPAVTVAAGVAMLALDLPGAYCIVAVWLILCGLSLYGIEKYIHELQLDQYDALLNAEAHEQVTSLYLKGMSGQLEQVQAGTPLSTGVDAALNAAIARRSQETPRPSDPRREPVFTTEQPSLFPESEATPSAAATDSPPEFDSEAHAKVPPAPSVEQRAEPASVPRPAAMNGPAAPVVALAAVATLLAVFGYDYYRKSKAAPTGLDRIEIVTVNSGGAPVPDAAAPQVAPAPQVVEEQREKAAQEHQYALKAARLAKAHSASTLPGGFAWRVNQDGINAYIAIDAQRAKARIRELRARAEQGDKAAQNTLALIYGTGVYQAGTGVFLIPTDEAESNRWLLRGQSPP